MFRRRVKPAPLLSDARRRDLDRIGREAYGPPYTGAVARNIRPHPADLLLAAAAAMGIQFPSPASANWSEFEARLCTELLEAADTYGGWTIAGALYVAADLDTRSSTQTYLRILDRAARLLNDERVPAEYMPPFVLERWVAANGPWAPDAEPAHGPSALSDDVEGAPHRGTEARCSADEADDSNAVRELGLMRRELGDIEGAEAAFRRAEELGDVEAIELLAYLLEDHRNDIAGAEAAWQRADAAGSVTASMMLGVTRRARGNEAGALEAFTRAEERGHKDAAASIGSILEDRGDGAGAEAAYRRADRRGSVYGAFNLGLLLMARGDQDGARQAWQHADDRGDAEGAANLGSLLREGGETAGAEAAYRRADERGSALGSWQLGEMLEARGELVESQGAYERAAERDSPPGAFALARVHLKREDIPAARAALARAAELGHPDAEDRLADLARVEEQDVEALASETADELPAWLGIDADVQGGMQDVAAKAARDPVRFLTYHETLRIYVPWSPSRSGERSPADLREAAASGDAEALIELGLDRERSGEFDVAYKAFADAAACGDTYAMFRLGFMHEVHRGDDDEALRHYLLADAAGDVNGAGNAGRLLKARGDLLEAERAFGRCFERGGTRALSDHAGLMSHRRDATYDELCDVVVKLCAVEDLWVQAQPGDLETEWDEHAETVSDEVGPPLAVFVGMWKYCDPGVMEAGVRAADSAGSASGAYHLGVVLRERKDLEHAEKALLRAHERGYQHAAEELLVVRRMKRRTSLS